MVLKVCLPLEELFEQKGVTRIVIETTVGSMGLLPRRQDCVALIVPGIVVMEVDGKESYMVVDEGVLVKTGPAVSLSVRHAVVHADLGQLKKAMELRLLQQSDEDRRMQETLSRIEGGVLRRCAERMRSG